MKIGVGGCSNTSVSYGEPWHYYMGQDINCEIVSIFSGAHGNEINIEKIISHLYHLFLFLVLNIAKI